MARPATARSCASGHVRVADVGGRVASLDPGPDAAMPRVRHARLRVVRRDVECAEVRAGDFMLKTVDRRGCGAPRIVVRRREREAW